ncbi:NAD-dependent epimerase/dehydratase family protein [Amycolatopsis panacis]|uniref:SDR family oxidoreductase n=1 Tax=Amycolatopsis panacis TaxID=2340917 RepID=A0A419HX47_9PSEU|nr:SDR family oxidoreductase [Amycolatopsis panacis]RJQ81691.1 SDR family oxidoreductase [Amycolatopsis panacis]
MTVTMVTGGAGYIGRILVAALVNTGRHVVVVDRLLYAQPPPGGADTGVEFLHKDIRDLAGSELSGVDELFDLAAISTEGAADLLPELTWEINDVGRRRLADLARRSGVRRYLLPSSSNVYGARAQPYGEDDEVAVASIYAKANHAAEQGVLRLASASFTPIVLRQATVYGWSPSMRYDLAINAMTADLLTRGCCQVMGDGRQRRPFVWVRDLVRVHLRLLELPAERVAGNVINVGSAGDEFAVGALPGLLGRIAGVEPEIGYYGVPDRMSHGLSYRRLNEITGMELGPGLHAGVTELATHIRAGSAQVGDPSTRRANWMEATWCSPTN